MQLSSCTICSKPPPLNKFEQAGFLQHLKSVDSAELKLSRNILGLERFQPLVCPKIGGGCGREINSLLELNKAKKCLEITFSRADTFRNLDSDNFYTNIAVSLSRKQILPTVLPIHLKVSHFSQRLDQKVYQLVDDVIAKLEGLQQQFQQNVRAIGQFQMVLNPREAAVIGAIVGAIVNGIESIQEATNMIV